MIFYFSATGNSKHVACQLAKTTGDKAVNILDYPLEQSIDLVGEEMVGIITPVYCGGVPYPVVDFLKKAKLIIDKDAYLYFVGTYGNLSGRSGSISGKYLKKNIGRTFDATYGVCMPDTWTPVFDLTNRDQLAEINRKAENTIEGIVEKVKALSTGDYMEDKLAVWMEVVYPSMYKKLSETKNLKVEDSCVGCGLCAEKCPTQTIHMENGKPAWTKKNCAMCLRCLHYCPQFAIQYGENTKMHGQYHYPGVEI